MLSVGGEGNFDAKTQGQWRPDRHSDFVELPLNRIYRWYRLYLKQRVGIGQ